ncbi:synaptonemal complex central element protein 2 [Aplochiton taeniatus]
MAQFFLGKAGPISQSTPKPGYHPPAVKDYAKEGHDMDMDNLAEETLSFVTLDGSNGQHSEDSGISNSNISGKDESISEALAETATQIEKKPPLCSKIEELGKRAQDLIERINQRRAMDQQIMASFENKLISKVTEVCQQVKEQMFSRYEEQGIGMEASLQELSQVLEHSSQLTTELQGASQTLSFINTNLQKTPGP